MIAVIVFIPWHGEFPATVFRVSTPENPRFRTSARCHFGSGLFCFPFINNPGMWRRWIARDFAKVEGAGSSPAIPSFAPLAERQTHLVAGQILSGARVPQGAFLLIFQWERGLMVTTAECLSANEGSIPFVPALPSGDFASEKQESWASGKPTHC